MRQSFFLSLDKSFFRTPQCVISLCFHRARLARSGITQSIHQPQHPISKSLPSRIHSRHNSLGTGPRLLSGGFSLAHSSSRFRYSRRCAARSRSRTRTPGLLPRIDRCSLPCRQSASMTIFHVGSPSVVDLDHDESAADVSRLMLRAISSTRRMPNCQSAWLPLSDAQ